MTKRLLLFAVIYTGISFFLLNEIPKGEHGNLLMIPVVIIFWIVAAILLFGMYKIKKKRTKSKWNILLFIFCTPIPSLLYVFGSYIWITSFEFQTTQKVYTRNGYIIKEVSYIYQKKKEYWSNFDSPANYYLLDSVIYFDKKENKYQTEIYKDWQRIKGDTETAKLPTIEK